MTPARLLDLPDEPILRIFAQLRPSHSTNSRFFINAKHAFSLAICNRRLLQLFSETLHTISAKLLPPISGDAKVLDSLSISQFAQLIRLAGPSLKVLHLPLHRNPHLGTLLLIVSRHCPNVQEISYCSTSTASAEKLLLDSHRAIRILHVSGAATLPDRFIHTTKLEELRITNVRPEHRKSLQGFLSRHCGKLRHFSISFATPENSHDPELITSESTILCDYIGSQKASDLPSLELLEVEVKCLAQLGYAGLVRFVDTAEEIVEKTRSDVKPGYGSCLQKIRLTGDAPHVTVFLQRLAELIGTHTDVEAKTLQTGIKFSGHVEAVQAMRGPLIQFFLLSRKTIDYAARHAEQFSCLETLKLTNDGITWNEAEQDVLGNIVVRAGSHLRNVCQGPWHSSDNHIRRFLTLFTDLMKKTISVEFIELCCRTIELALADSDTSTLERLVASLRNVRVLHLSPSTTFSFPRRRYNDDYGKFVCSLPRFLERIKLGCPRLEVLYLTATELKGPVGYNMAKHTHEALDALDKFHTARPEVDAQSVIAQLKEWLKLHYMRTQYNGIVNIASALRS